MKVCRCCKSQISTQKCHNCGFINIAALDEESEIQEQKLADEYRVSIRFYDDLKIDLCGVLKNGEKSNTDELDYSSMSYDMLLKVAMDGDAKAQFRLGCCYNLGIGVDRSLSKAAEYYEKAATNGHAEAQKNLGNCYYIGNGVVQSYNKAVEWYEKAAVLGQVEAQRYLGNCYYYGKGVSQSYSEAMKWYKKAADQGDEQSQANVANCYYSGIGVEQDLEKAIRLCKEMKDQGHRNTPRWYTEELKADLEYELEGPNMKDLIRGDNFYDNKKFIEAAKLYEKAAMQGNVIAQTYLGDCYRYGEGVDKDLKKAEQWYRKAVLKGYVRARLALGHKIISNYDHKIPVAVGRCIVEALNGKLRSQRLLADWYGENHPFTMEYYTNVDKNGYVVDNEWFLEQKYKSDIL